MKFDDIITDIGEFGPYQIKVFLMVGLIGIPVGYNQMAQVFYASKSDHWCAVQEWAEDYQRCGDPGNVGYYLDCIHAIRNASIPYSISKEGDIIYDQCHKYDLDYSSFNWTEGPSETSTDGEFPEVPCDEGWIYDRHENPRTIISDVSEVVSYVIIFTHYPRS